MMDANELDEILDRRLRAAFPSEAERRRYALLQAAAVLMASAEFFMLDDALNAAHELLSEIEKREVKP